MASFLVDAHPHTTVLFPDPSLALCEDYVHFSIDHNPLCVKPRNFQHYKKGSDQANQIPRLLPKHNFSEAAIVPVQDSTIPSSQTLCNLSHYLGNSVAFSLHNKSLLHTSSSLSPLPSQPTLSSIRFLGDGLLSSTAQAPCYPTWKPTTDKELKTSHHISSIAYTVLTVTVNKVNLRVIEVLEALLFLHRAVDSGHVKFPFSLTENNFSMALLCALMVAHKINTDRPSSNRFFASLFSVCLGDLNRSEIYLLRTLGWHVGTTEYEYGILHAIWILLHHSV
ncbi:hypothetical protein BLNAU_13699 [Blattamonas nauphoetae]|uniref:Cyclin N-terminal domain-containing protein n=1 Tax=Blattamonas nauphoetae TaxID=2049346 RepID=A0ABQ9XIQ3_9EUKA|nr:hypothetical protein BLNAU_13699 [Blattamonas nauphoetae]